MEQQTGQQQRSAQGPTLEQMGSSAAKQNKPGERPQTITPITPKDWRQEVELQGLWSVGNFPGSGYSSIVKGQSHSNSLSINGLVTGIFLMPNGTIRVEVRQSASPGMPPERLAQHELRYILVFNGFTSEVAR